MFATQHVYGILHAPAPACRESFAADLKKALSRIPFAPDFKAFCEAGRRLAGLHLNFDAAEGYKLDLMRDGDPILPGVPPTAADKSHRTRTIYNERLPLEPVPEQALRYIVNGYPALGRIIDRWQVKKDKDSGITNDPNDWIEEQGDPQWLICHIKRITHISVESARIIEEQANLEILAPDKNRG